MNIVIPVGGGTPVSVSRKDVNFYDYEGTLLYSYTLAEAQALASLPTAPTHTGLTFQEWNYTLSQVTATTRPMDVGTTYITDDGKTRLYIHVENTARATVPLYWSQTVANGVTIEFGDNTNPGTYSGTGNLNTTHTYAAAGDYCITLYPASGCALGLGNGTYTSVAIGGSNYGYSNAIYKIEMGVRVDLSNPYALYNCYSLETITLSSSITYLYTTFGNCYNLKFIAIPRSVTSLAGSCFANCFRLTGISLSTGVTVIGDTCFDYCYSLLNIIVPDSVTLIGNYAFEYCTAASFICLSNSLTSVGHGAFTRNFSAQFILMGSSITTINSSTFSYGSFSSLTIPASVTSIGDSAFNSCAFAKEYHFLSTTPPTLGGGSVFTNIPSDCVIYVPTASVDTYKAASYWSAHASKITGE